MLARKYRPQDFTGLIGQEALVRTLRNAFAAGRIAHAFMLTGRARRGQDHHRAHHRPRAELHRPRRQADGAHHRSLRRVRALPRDRRIAPCRCAGNGRRLAHRHRRHPRDHRRRALCAGRGALQGLHHRRSAHAVEAGLQRPAQDAGRAAAACEVHLRHHRNPQGAGDGAVALPALRSAAHRDRRAWPPISPRIAEKEKIAIEPARAVA